MTIFEIDEQIATLLNGVVDDETGEIIFSEDLNRALEQLTIARDVKIENCALAYKQYMAEAAALKAEKKFLVDPLDKRIRHLEASAKKASAFLEFALQGQPFKTSKVNIGYSKAESTEYDDDFIKWAQKNKKKYPDILTPQEPKVNKTAVKKYIKEGAKILHAWLASGKIKIE